MARLLADFAEEAGHRGLDVGIVTQAVVDKDKGDFEWGILGENVMVKAIGLADSPTHLDAVNGMAQPLFGYHDKETRADGAVGTRRRASPDGAQRKRHGAFAFTLGREKSLNDGRTP